MPATRRVLNPALARLLAVLMLAAAAFVPQLVQAQSASALAPSMVGVRAVSVAATRRGAVYRLGAQGPRAFDCSGLTRWSYARVGKRLPRTAQQQWAATLHIRPTSRRPGDLVFFFSGRRVYHVAMYAGNGYIWHAPKPGTRVKRVKLWTSHVRYGRVR
ncbi:MAG TPA: C40 family peptidase [Angustibacter sp.]|nr:C40 family peptidase [Angustibacter sp.]